MNQSKGGWRVKQAEQPEADEAERKLGRGREGEAMVRGKRRYDIPSGKEVVAILESEAEKKR